MALLKIDIRTRVIAIIAVAFGFSAFVLACVGLATPNWYVKYTSDPSTGSQYRQSSANFFYSCDYQTNDIVNRCVARSNGVHYYPTFSDVPWYFDYMYRMQDAGALCIVGIVSLGVGVVLTLAMVIVPFPIWLYFLPPTALFVACVFMLAGMAEGAAYILYNGYSAILYQSALVITTFSLFLSAFAAGRVQFARWTDAAINTRAKQPTTVAQ